MDAKMARNQVSQYQEEVIKRLDYSKLLAKIDELSKEGYDTLYEFMKYITLDGDDNLPSFTERAIVLHLKSEGFKYTHADTCYEDAEYISW